MVKLNHAPWMTAAAICAIAWGSAVHAADTQISIASGGGSSQEGGRAAQWGPAAEKLGYTVKEDTIDEGLNAVRLQVGANKVTYDIVQMAEYEGALGGQQGVLMPLDYKTIETTGFLPGTAEPYCIGYMTYSLVMAWNTKTYGDNGPNTWADFWDVKKFPGRRAMRANAEGQLEIALMADGVAPADVYKVLSSDGGVKRAIDKIEQLKPNIAVWWKSGSQHLQLMRDGEVDMSTGWNGRFEAAIKDGGPTKFTYNQGVMGTDCYAIPKGAPHAADDMAMLNLMSTPEALAKLVKYTNYGPTNLKAFDTGLIAPDKVNSLPTSPANAKLQLQIDSSWWAKNNDKAQSMFDDMMTR